LEIITFSSLTGSLLKKCNTTLNATNTKIIIIKPYFLSFEELEPTSVSFELALQLKVSNKTFVTNNAEIIIRKVFIIIII
jgi:hypothetical protein